MGDNVWVVVVSLILIAIIYLCICIIANHILYGLAMTKMSKNQGFRDGWLSWIPLLNIFVVPLLARYSMYGIIRKVFMPSYIVLWIVFLISQPPPQLTLAIFSLGVVYGKPFASLDLFVTYFGTAFYLGIILYLIWLYTFYIITRQYSNRTALHLVIAIVTFGISTPQLRFNCFVSVDERPYRHFIHIAIPPTLCYNKSNII